jgi:AraC-like DNA-binding protein
MARTVAYYREFAPSEALREQVRAFFSFVPGEARRPERPPPLREIAFAEGDSFCSPLFADGHASLILNFGRACHTDGRWSATDRGPNGLVIGPMSVVGRVSSAECPEMIGVYFRAAQVAQLIHTPASEVADQIVSLEDLWGASGRELPADLNEASEADRITRLESALLDRLGKAKRPATGVNAGGLASWVSRQSGRLTVESLSKAAGVSRQHLTRVFRECVGVTPKLYCRLVRFQSGLCYAGRGKDVNWAEAAIELGYADQSHMIAEFRQFSSLTPQQLASGNWFHPFIERAVARRRDHSGPAAAGPSA